MLLFEVLGGMWRVDEGMSAQAMKGAPESRRQVMQ